MNGRTWPHHGMSDYALRTRSSVLHRFWRDHISDKNSRRGNIPPYARAPLVVPKATFSFAMTVMDKVEGWNEEKCLGSKFASSMWIYTKAVLCDGCGRGPPLDLKPLISIIMESVSCVIEDILWEHEWVTEPSVLLKENDILEALNYDIDVPCPVQWGLLWFSAQTNLNRKFVNNGTKVAKIRERVNNAIELTFIITFDEVHTPRACLLRSVSILFSYAPDRDFMVSHLFMTETDAPCSHPVLRLIPLLRTRSSGLSADFREGPRKEAQEGCFGNLLQKMWLVSLLI